MTHAFHIAMAKGFMVLGGLLGVYLVACGISWVIGWLFERAAAIAERKAKVAEYSEKLSTGNHGKN